MTQITLLSLDRAWGGPGHLPLAGSLRVLLQVMSELRQLHEGQGEAHGALTPALVSLTDDSTVRLSAPGPSPYRLHYLAPEKLRGEAVTERSDVFSVGVLLWEALAGKPLLELTLREDILARWRADMAPLAPVRDPFLWARSLSHIAARALAIEPTQRYANIRQFQAALETLAGRHAANLDAWDTMLKGPPGTSLRKTDTDLLPDLSHLTGNGPRLRPFQQNTDDTVFDITARPPELDFDDDHADPARALPALAFALAPPDEDELPTRFMAPKPRPPSVALSVAPTPARKPAPLSRPPIIRARRPEPALLASQSAQKPPHQARTAWVLVVLLAVLFGALSSQLARPAPPPAGAH